MLAVEVAGRRSASLLVESFGRGPMGGQGWTVPYGVVSGALALALAALFPSRSPSRPCSSSVSCEGSPEPPGSRAAQLLVPTEMQGRYFGIDGLGPVAILPVAQIGGAFLIDVWGTQTTLPPHRASSGSSRGSSSSSRAALWRLGYPPAPEDAVSYRTATLRC